MSIYFSVYNPAVAQEANQSPQYVTHIPISARNEQSSVKRRGQRPRSEVFIRRLDTQHLTEIWSVVWCEDQIFPVFRQIWHQMLSGPDLLHLLWRVYTTHSVHCAVRIAQCASCGTHRACVGVWIYILPVRTQNFGDRMLWLPCSQFVKCLLDIVNC